MTRPRRPPPPLDAKSLDALALRYVERFATTRGKLARYLARKILERGWVEDAPRADPSGVADRMAALGYIDDATWGEAKASALSRRGYGARRVAQELHHAGIDRAAAAPLKEAIDSRAVEAALAYARRRRLGPYAAIPPSDRAARERALAAMLRAGHAMDLARTILRLDSPEAAEKLLESGQS